MKSVKTIDQKEVTGMIDYLAHAIHHQEWKPDVIVTMSKGGLIPSRLLAKKLNIKMILSYGISYYDENDKKTKEPVIYQGLNGSREFLRGKNILLVDDIVDTGDSLKHCIEHLCDLKVAKPDSLHRGSSRVYRTCSLYYKTQSCIHPDFTFDELNDDVWLIFPWE
jgi:hypothetical protein